MFTYRSKLVTYLALVLIGYLIFQKYKEKPEKIESLDIKNSQESKFTIKIDPNKKYEDLTLLEKWAFNSIKDKLPKSLRDNIESKGKK